MGAPLATDSGRTACTSLYPPVKAFFFLSRTEEPVKASTCAHDRRALQQLALNVHVKQSDLTYMDDCTGPHVDSSSDLRAED